MTATFLIDTNLPIDTDFPDLARTLRAFDVAIEGSTDLPAIGRSVTAHAPDIAYVPLADWNRRLREGDRHYRGLVIATSKFTGTTDYPSVLVTRRDDPAQNLADLRGASCGYINRSCTSSWFPPALMLADVGETSERFLDMRPVRAWQGQVDAVIAGEVRATMVPEDVWRTVPANAETTKIIDRYEHTNPALIIARHDLDRDLRAALLDALTSWVPPWTSIYGCFVPFLPAQVHRFFHELEKLPRGS